MDYTKSWCQHRLPVVFLTVEHQQHTLSFSQLIELTCVFLHYRTEIDFSISQSQVL